MRVGETENRGRLFSSSPGSLFTHKKYAYALIIYLSMTLLT